MKSSKQGSQGLSAPQGGSQQGTWVLKLGLKLGQGYMELRVLGEWIFLGSVFSDQV